jgi:hypothetical protein
MKTATLMTRPIPEAGPGVRAIEIQCRHGTTSGVARPEDAADLITTLLLYHYFHRRCSCSRPLRRRYDVP